MSGYKAFEKDETERADIKSITMTLHILQTRQSLQRALPAIAAEDCLLLLADACYLALSDTLPKSHSVYALTDDAILRGITLPDTISGIDMAEFVELSGQHTHSASW